jgi:hypothetical protein
LLRQIRKYQHYGAKRFFVVSPDTRYRHAIVSEGIGFWEPGRDEERYLEELFKAFGKACRRRFSSSSNGGAAAGPPSAG